MQFFQLASVLLLASGITAATLEPKFEFVPVGDDFTVSAACRDIRDGIVFDCGSSTDDFIIKSVTLTPKVPKKGQKLKVNLVGDIRETVVKGSNAHVTAKLGIITVVDKDYDLCDAIADDKVKCPLAKGPLDATKELDVPSNIPSGNYVADVVATSPSKKQIFRIQLKLRV